MSRKAREKSKSGIYHIMLINSTQHNMETRNRPLSLFLNILTTLFNKSVDFFFSKQKRAVALNWLFFNQLFATAPFYFGERVASLIEVWHTQELKIRLRFFKIHSSNDFKIWFYRFLTYCISNIEFGDCFLQYILLLQLGQYGLFRVADLVLQKWNYHNCNK